MFKTLADIKKATKPGSVWRCTWRNGTAKTREIVRAQSNAITFNDNGRESWLYWEKAERYDILPEGFRVYWPGEHTDANFIMQYDFVK
ncbi:MAG: hypothetical protein J6N45_07590 [Alphaproteobacteria bacterium]|nr:hypothetical protein [Alphaproteobacteria bacterium]